MSESRQSSLDIHPDPAANLPPENGEAESAGGGGWETTAASHQITRYRPVVVSPCPPHLTEFERYWLARYRAWNSVQRIAIRCYINTGDLRLLLFVWDSLLDEPQEGAQFPLP